jgi:hypothetical protein
LPNWWLITGSRSWLVKIRDASRFGRAPGTKLSEWQDSSSMGDHRLERVKSVALEEWLDSIKWAKGTRAKIRNIMSAICHHAMRNEWVERNLWHVSNDCFRIVNNWSFGVVSEPSTTNIT